VERRPRPRVADEDGAPGSHGGGDRPRDPAVPSVRAYSLSLVIPEVAVPPRFDVTVTDAGCATPVRTTV
jgi:hypothetical protein